ncbi:MAG: Hsp20/alpha crystallin family protein [Desulfobacteraceae bacterium]|nr:Hsp20/alpha crystallin family protein [Desulfobacteraceae bacterium]
MGSRKLDLHASFYNTSEAVDKIFTAAFGPSMALYRHISLCGWRLMEIAIPNGNALNESSQIESNTSFQEPASGIEIYETHDAVTIEVALTYVKEESLHLSISGKTVIIRGERILSAPSKSKAPNPARCLTYFQHLIPLPASVKAGGFRAQLKGDVVQINFAKHHHQ